MDVPPSSTPLPPELEETLFQDSLRIRRLVHQAADQMASACLEGKTLLSISPETWRIVSKGLHIPTSTTITGNPPDREDVDNSLLQLNRRMDSQRLSATSRLRFLCRFSRHLEKSFPGCEAWKRLLVDEEKRERRFQVRKSYDRFYHHPPILYPDGSCGQWEISAQQERPDPLEDIQTCIRQTGTVLKIGPRATLWNARLNGIPVVIKRYEVNPKIWRRKWETCRALRAWSGAKLLQNLGISAPRPVGWLKVGRGDDQGVSYYISEDLPESEPVRTWLRREWKQLSPASRVGFRHALRNEILQLYQYGLAHSDCKLSNVRIDPGAAYWNQWQFTWTDLEDIQPRLNLNRVFVRNMYQINGSLPREVSAEDRTRFLKGFVRLFPYAESPLLFRYIRRVTRQRHRRELNRVCGA